MSSYCCLSLIGSARPPVTDVVVAIPAPAAAATAFADAVDNDVADDDNDAAAAAAAVHTPAQTIPGLITTLEDQSLLSQHIMCLPMIANSV